MSRILTQDIYVSLQSLSEKSFFGLALLIKTKRTLKHWLIKRQEQVGHSTTRNLSDLDTQVTRTELDECLDICMRQTCIACKFCKWRWAPMQFGTLSDYGAGMHAPPRPAPTPGEMAAPGRPGPENFQECPAPPRPTPKMPRGLTFFFLAIPKTCISVLWVTRHNRVWGSKLIGITLHFYIGHLGLGCIFFFISLTFNCLVRSRLAERVTWLDSSRWGSPCSCE